MSSPATFIAADAYPQLPPVPALALKKALRSPKVLDAAKAALQAGEEALRPAVLTVIEALAQAAEDPTRLYGLSHEIRGLAGNAGLPAVAKIASLLCHYLDTIQRALSTPDPQVVSLHIVALARAAQENGESTAVEEAVLQGLSALVARKITENGASEVTSSFSGR